MVTGTAATKLSADGKAAVEQYRQYLEAQTAELVTTTKAFTDAVDSGNLEQAKALYAPSRIAYERIEPVAETFGDLDPKIDAREGDVPKKEWGGYHYLEQKLWVDGTTDGSDLVHQGAERERRDPAEPGEGRRTPAGRHRQRRGRAAQRGVGVEDHG